MNHHSMTLCSCEPVLHGKDTGYFNALSENAPILVEIQLQHVYPGKN